MSWINVFAEAAMRLGRGQLPFQLSEIKDAANWDRCLIGEYAPSLGQKWQAEWPSEASAGSKRQLYLSGKEFHRRLKAQDLPGALVEFGVIQSAIAAYRKKYHRAP